MFTGVPGFLGTDPEDLKGIGFTLEKGKLL